LWYVRNFAAVHPAAFTHSDVPGVAFGDEPPSEIGFAHCDASAESAVAIVAVRPEVNQARFVEQVGIQNVPDALCVGSVRAT
jgi:hypothetical protein